MQVAGVHRRSVQPGASAAEFQIPERPTRAMLCTRLGALWNRIGVPFPARYPIHILRGPTAPRQGS